MSTSQTIQTSATVSVEDELLARRATKIAAIEADDQVLASVLGKKDQDSKRLRDSAGGRKACAVAAIRKLELDLAIEGCEVEPYTASRVGVKTSHTGRTAEEYAADLTKIAAVYHSTRFESVKASADSRIAALLKAATKAGHELTDPR